MEIFSIAASLDRDALRLDLSEPAFIALVDRAVAPYAHVFTPEGLAEARETAAFALASRPDVDSILERERARQASGTQPVRGVAPVAATPIPPVTMGETPKPPAPPVATEARKLGSGAR